MDNYLAELAKSRGQMLQEIADANWGYEAGKQKIAALREEVEKIDRMIDKVLATPPIKGKE